MSELTRNEYWKEIEELADDLVKRAKDGEFGTDEQAREGLYEAVWETLDGHQWVIYTAYNYAVLSHSDHDGYAIEEWGSDGVVEKGVLRSDRLAFGAMYGDLNEALFRREGFDVNDPNPTDADQD